MKFFRSKRWSNWGGNISVNPFNLKDTSLLDNEKAIEAVQESIRQSGTLKIVGSGHSFSDILDTKGTLLYRSKKSLLPTLPVVIDPDKTVLKAGNDECIIQISAMATLDEVNKALKKRGLAFNNLGSAVLQTYGGAISTSTHGTGRDIPPLCDDVRSMLMISPEWGICRIERTEGVTDKDKFQQAFPRTRLIQDDKIFCATLVSLGCMGVMLDYITHVRPCYKLEETRSFVTWRQLRKELKEMPEKYLGSRHFDIIMNPYDRKGENSCVITSRRIVPVDTPSTRDIGKFIRWLVAVFQVSIGRLLKDYPLIIGRFLDISIRSLVKKTPYVDESTAIFDIDLINKVRAISAEYTFRINDSIYLDAIDAFLNEVRKNVKTGLHHNSPFGIRFIGPSTAFLSMMHGEAMCTIETPLLANTKGWKVILNSYERICMQYKGRPHWGQYNELTGEVNWLIENYSQAKDWLDVLHQSDPKGVFRNKFTKRMGFEYNE